MENNAASSLPARAQQSQWLHTTLSDLDRKMKGVINLLEEDNNSSCQKADISRARKLELRRLLGEVNISYNSLVEKYEQLMSKLQNFPHSGPSSSLVSNSRETHETINQSRGVDAFDYPIMEVSDSHLESVVDGPDFEHYTPSYEYLNKLANDLTLTEQCSMSFIRIPEEIDREFFDEEYDISKINGFERFKTNVGEFQMGSSERENIRYQIKIQFTKLMEENLRQQAELLRRNDEKRQTIKELRLQLEHLKSENKALQKYLRRSKNGMKHNHSQTSRSKGLFLGKFFQGGCS